MVSQRVTVGLHCRYTRAFAAGASSTTAALLADCKRAGDSLERILAATRMRTASSATAAGSSATPNPTGTASGRTGEPEETSLPDPALVPSA